MSQSLNPIELEDRMFHRLTSSLPPDLARGIAMVATESLVDLMQAQSFYCPRTAALSYRNHAIRHQIHTMDVRSIAHLHHMSPKQVWLILRNRRR